MRGAYGRRHGLMGVHGCGGCARRRYCKCIPPDFVHECDRIVNITGVRVLSLSNRRVRMSVLLRTVVTSLRSKNTLTLTLVNVRVGASMRN